MKPSAPHVGESTLGLPPELRIYLVVLTVGVLCSLAIVSTYAWTRPIILGNRIAQRDAAIAGLLPTAVTIQPFEYRAESGEFVPAQSAAAETELVFAAFDSGGQLSGIAIESGGMGYQDMIRLLYAFAPDQQAVTGIRILESRETPGLGDRIESDDAFLDNFTQLDVSLSRDGQQLAAPIEFVKPGTKTEPWQIDGITGATISSRAVAGILRDSTLRWIPRIQARRRDFIPAPPSE
jgi:electron transport complex protein RnfG